jgi:hypothetical protein
MKQIVLNVPTFGFAVVTRAMIGAGIALLLSDRVAAERRRTVGLALIMIGAAATVPVVRAVMRGSKPTALPA